MSRRRFEELDHPRWPRGTPVAPGGRGPGGGRFREEVGGSWAAAVVDAIAGGGSIATGETAECPVCHRTVKLVGNGKLSTHNKRKGVRCEGSGSSRSRGFGEIWWNPPPQKVRRRASGGYKPVTHRTGPPRPPDVKHGDNLDRVDDPAAAARLEGWVAGTRQQHTQVALVRQIKQQRDEVARQKDLVKQAKNHALRLWHIHTRGAGGSWNFGERDREEFLAQDAGLAAATTSLQRAEQALARLEKRRRSGDFDPTDPLGAYGRMLHIEGDSWFIYKALDSLEQRVPATFHRAAADWLAAKDGGIWIGDRQRPTEMDDLAHLARERVKSKSWAKGTTYADIDGLVSDYGRVMAVVHNANADRSQNKKFGNQRQVNHLLQGNTDPDLPVSVGAVDGSAVLHEFGHVLDWAMGWREPYSVERRASQQRMWRIIHSRVKREAGRGLNPHFTQSGHAGPAEFWADAFDTWASGDPTEVPFRGTGKKRKPTLQDILIQDTYRVSLLTAMGVSDYFARLQREVETGKRIPLLDQEVN